MDIQNILINISENDYGDQYKNHVMEMYKLYVVTTDLISARRYKANSFFLTINTVLVGFGGYAYSGSDETSRFLWLIGLAGVVLCYTWYRLVRSFAQLNKVRFEIIHALENELPLSIYRTEWEILDHGKNPKKYSQFSAVEGVVPWVFICLHAVILAISLPWDIIAK